MKLKSKLFLCIVFLAAIPLLAGGTPTAALKQADDLYSQRIDPAQATDALLHYERALTLDPAYTEAFWKAARACHWIADHSEIKKEKISTFEKGIVYAKKAVELDPKCVEAHFWLGALYGSYGEVKGVMKSLALVKPIREEMKSVINLNERYQGGGGYRVLGIVDYKVPGFAGGNKKRALEELNKSLSIDPLNPFNQFYLAEFYSVDGDKQKALEHLQTLETLRATQDVDDPDLKMIQIKGDKLRKKIGG